MVEKSDEFDECTYVELSKIFPTKILHFKILSTAYFTGYNLLT